VEETGKEVSSLGGREKPVHWLDEVGGEDADLVGKKCANLGEMAKLGLPVPRGFCISVEAHRIFLSETGIRQEIAGAVEARGAPHSLKQYADTAGTLRGVVETAGIPSWLRDAVMQAYDRLSQACGGDCAVAVRSAGTESHPGQYETYLNVRGGDAVVANIVKVWSSIYNERTLASLDRRGLAPPDSPPIGVAIIESIDARASGVCFTCDPSSGDDSRVVLEGAWGLGEGVVSGLVNPDSFVLDKSTLTIEARNIGDKKVRVVAVEQGTEIEETPPRLRRIPCLTDSEVSRIAELAVALERHFGCPQDVEWCVGNELPRREDVFLLQTRPVRGLGMRPAPGARQLQAEALAKLRALRGF
jgi:pyruvate,water dikinase